MIEDSKLIIKDNLKKINNIIKKILPKLEYHNFVVEELEENKISSSKKYICPSKDILYKNINSNTINIYITKLFNYKCLIPKNFLEYIDI